MKLGEAVKAIEFSADEKQRIGSLLLQKNTAQYKVVYSKIQNAIPQSFWGKIQRAHKITGFRVGHPKARTAILERVIQHYKMHPTEENSEIWFFYEICVKKYIVDELPQLNSALLIEDIEDGKHPTAKILKSIAELSPIYGFSIDDINALYDIWWFDRIENPKELVVETVGLSKKISKIVDFEYKRLNASITDLAESVNRKIASLAEESAQLRRKTEENIEEIKKSINSTLAGLDVTENENLKLQLVDHFSEVDDKLSSLSLAVDKTAEDQVRNFENIKADIASRFSEHEEYIQSYFNGDANEKKARVEEGKVKGHLERWPHIRDRFPIQSNSDRIYRALIAFLQRTRVVITEEADFFSSFLENFGSAKTERIAVSPLWLSGNDWKKELHLIAKHTETPISLVVLDFDVAIQEVYLLPGLSYFLSETTSGICNKIILVPSKPDLIDINSRLLEQCPYIESVQLLMDLLESDEREHPSSLSTYVDLISDRPLIPFEDTYNHELEVQLRKICKNAGVLIPNKIAALFVNLYTGLSFVAHSDTALNIAMITTILPWAKKTLGSSKAMILEETLKMMLS